MNISNTQISENYGVIVISLGITWSYCYLKGGIKSTMHQFMYRTSC